MCAFSNSQPEPFMTYLGFELTVNEHYPDFELEDYLTYDVERVGQTYPGECG